MLNRDGKMGILLLAGSSLLCYGAIRLGIGKAHDPGPGFFPLLAGALIAILSLVLISSSRNAKADALSAKVPLLTGRAAMTLGVFLLCGLFVERAGFFVCTFLVTVVMLRVNGIKRWPMLFVAAALTCAGIYLVFNVLLDVRLPLGILQWNRS